MAPGKSAGNSKPFPIWKGKMQAVFAQMPGCVLRHDPYMWGDDDVPLTTCRWIYKVWISYPPTPLATCKLFGEPGCDVSVLMYGYHLCNWQSIEVDGDPVRFVNEYYTGDPERRCGQMI